MASSESELGGKSPSPFVSPELSAAPHHALLWDLAAILGVSTASSHPATRQQQAAVPVTMLAILTNVMTVAPAKEGGFPWHQSQ